jgi:hypothetical protein
MISHNKNKKVALQKPLYKNKKDDVQKIGLVFPLIQSKLGLFFVMLILILIILAVFFVGFNTGRNSSEFRGENYLQDGKDSFDGKLLSVEKLNEIQSKIKSFILEKYSNNNGLIDANEISVDYNENATLDFSVQFSIYFEENGQKKIKGVVYANEEKFVLVNTLPIDFNSINSKKNTINVENKEILKSEKVPVEIKKSDSPLIELFIWSYCPFGVNALKPFAEVANILGNETNFEVLLYYGGHGDFEVQQNKIQACLQKYEKDKYWDYAKAFALEIYPKCASLKDAVCDQNESNRVMLEMGIDFKKINSCVDLEGKKLIDEHAKRASLLGVKGSPSLMLNEVKSNSARTAEAYKEAICNSFINPPISCEKTILK